MSSTTETKKDSDRVSIIGAVKTYLGFFVLVVLVVEAVLGALALKADGPNQLVALYGMLFVIVALIVVVSFFAYRKPEALLRVSGDATGEVHAFQEFSQRIAGTWWERIESSGSTAISLVHITPDARTNSVKMIGTGYDANGNVVSNWKSVACGVDPIGMRVLYYWDGAYPSKANHRYAGFGEISFHANGSTIDSGTGSFSDTNLAEMHNTTLKPTVFQRCNDSACRDAQPGTTTATLRDLIRTKLS